jgi:hypothetical protein
LPERFALMLAASSQGGSKHMRVFARLPLAAAALALAQAGVSLVSVAGVSSAKAADLGVPEGAPPPAYYGPPPVEQGYAYPPPAPPPVVQGYAYPVPAAPPPVYYGYASPPIGVYGAGYYWRRPYWGGYAPRAAYGYGRWGYRRW